jgi:hypothetical protein
MHLTELADRLQPVVAHLQQMITEGYETDILIGIFTTGQQGCWSVSAEVLRRLSTLGVSLVFDVYGGE